MSILHIIYHNSTVISLLLVQYWKLFVLLYIYNGIKDIQYEIPIYTSGGHAGGNYTERRC